MDPSRLSNFEPADGRLEIKCLKEIRVGAPKVSGGRIARAPIHIEAQDGLRAGFELQWRYPAGTLRVAEDGPRLENLFTLTALLPLLNYLPFARHCTVEGPLDTGDAEWIGRLAEATAREIERHKLTPENPYLRAEVLSSLSAQPLSVPPLRANLARVAAARCDTDGGRAAVILDGSAESLLSWALLDEVKASPLAVAYENPATGLGPAANAFDFLQPRHPARAASIWTNLPHLYDFFLRHFDFLRANYQTVHADTTPLRLFESEVGVLAALPILWSARCGHAILPRRTDSLERRAPGSSPQPQMLFDQTRAFDDYITRFFSRKGWGVQQWSILRPASELVVQRTLSSRYSDLFALQVGCLRPRMEARRPAVAVTPRQGGIGEEEDIWPVEAEPDHVESETPNGHWAEGGAHRNGSGGEAGGEAEPAGTGHSTEGKRRRGRPDGGLEMEVAAGLSTGRFGAWGRRRPDLAIPCGACEACRRLVAILTALGLEARALGYTPAKIERSLSHARRVGHLPPEARIQRHVLHLLEKAQGGRKAAAGAEAGGDRLPAPAAAERVDPRAAESRPAEPRPAASSRFEPHPEVEALRFDGVRTFLDTIPLSFRKPIYAILLNYANGAARRDGREWKPFDLLNSPEILLPKHPRDIEFLVS